MSQGQTIIFFDEIQKCPEIVTKIKFLVDEGSFKYVMSGSLLGVELRGISSAPVGYLTVLRMYPMDFEEFMIANNVSGTTLNMLKAHFENYVAQQLAANGYELYFFKKNGLGEVDFVIEQNGKVIPIEVKSGKSYRTHKALDNLMIVELDTEGL